MKRTLLATALLEAGAGTALVCCPSAAVALLLSSGLNTPAAVTLGRMTGAALFALGIACWFAGLDQRSQAARGLIGAMLVYNLAVVAIFTVARIGSGLTGVALWPAVVLHAAMAVWCITCLRRNRVSQTSGAPRPHG
jgi:hypothetical protein